MSERGSGFGPFVLGVAVGAALGFLFAPEPGEETRRHLAKRFRRIRSLAEEKAEELVGGAKELIAGEAEEEEPVLSARDELEQRLAEARRRRRGAGGGGKTPDDAEEDEPVA